MTLRVFLLVRRKPGITIDQFREHWERIHIEIMRDITGPDFPLAHTRHYVTMLYPPDQESPYDAIGELTFENKDKFDAFMNKISPDEAAARIAGNDEHFLDKASYKAFVVSDSTSSKKDGSFETF